MISLISLEVSNKPVWKQLESIETEVSFFKFSYLLDIRSFKAVINGTGRNNSVKQIKAGINQKSQAK